MLSHDWSGLKLVRFGIRPDQAYALKLAAAPEGVSLSELKTEMALRNTGSAALPVG
jgi:hypothetical protein